MMKSTKSCAVVVSCLIIMILYGIYQNVALDLDSIFNHNFNSDYLIDVSSLRDGSSEFSESSGLQKWDKVVSNGHLVAYAGNNCENPTKILGVAYLSKGAGNLLLANVHVNFTTDKDVGEGDSEVKILVTFGKLVIMNQVIDTCNIDSVVKCPLQKGSHAFFKQHPFPRFAPKGEYRAKIEIQDKSNGEIKLCAKGQIRF